MSEYAKGKVCVGFSYPVVAKYAAAAGVVSLTNGMVLARGVAVDVSVNTAGDNEFYADNALAESENDVFESGSLKLTVDGLFAEAERFITGQAEAVDEKFGETSVKLTKHSVQTVAPYVAVGVIAKYRSGGKTIFTPHIFPKTKFKAPGLKADTQGKSISWQVQELEAAICRDDSATADWKWVGEDFATEAEAKAALNTVCAVAAE